jgi:DNA polymerase-1
MKEKIFAIIDGNAIIHRAYHAIPPMSVKDGTVVNAVYGFTSMLLKVIQELSPDYIAVSFDVAGGTFRDEIYEAYKATRVKADQELYDQIPLVYDVVEAFNIPIYTKTGFEADDIIGTIVSKVKRAKPNVRSVIVTGDMDLLQLVDEDIHVYALRKGFSDVVMYDRDQVVEKYGFGPDMLVEYKALKGDTSDNIPGVAGIGDKTAKELIEKIGGIDQIYKQIRNQKSEIRNQLKPGVIKKLEAGEDGAKMSHELATIRKDVTGLGFKLADCVTHEYDRNEITALLRRFEFYSLLKRLPGGESEEEAAKKKAPKKASKQLLIVEAAARKSFLEELKPEKVFACKEVLSGKDVFTSTLAGFVFATTKGIYFVKANTVDAPLAQLFQDKTKILVGHDLKQLVKALLAQGEKTENKLFDIMIGSYLLNSSTRAHDVRSIVLREMGDEISSGTGQGSLFGVDPHVVGRELGYMLDIYKKFEKDLKEMDDEGLFKKVEMALVPILAEMELYGIAVDVDMLDGLSSRAAKIIKETEKKIWKEAGEEFNVASSVQLRDVLFERLDLPAEGIKKGKTGYSTAASELEKLRGIHPIIPLIEQFREVEKLRNTYIDVLPKLIDKKTGRIHTNFNQAVTTTGRLSSSEPNLQNIPIRTELGKEIRDAFIAEKGNILVAADYSQIELRIVASLAKDKKMIEIFKKNEDIHRATAAAINGVPLDKVTREMRYAAKEVNFGVLYGMGAYGLSWRAKIPQWQAKEFIDKYFEQFSGVKKYIDQTLRFAKKEGYVETLFGRRRYVPELQSKNYQIRNAGERMAINMPIQGTAADLMKMAMIRVHEKIKAKYSDSDVKLILQVHDELVLEVKKGLEKEVSKMVKEEMEQVVTLNVPVEVHVGNGKRWGELK